MIKLVALQIKKRVPIISILLIISCILSTVPQFFLPDMYSDITSQTAGIKSYYLFTLNAFTHSPNNLINHFIGNLLVFVCFGILTEIIIGSKRFAFITVLTFFSTIIVNYIHTTSKYLGHGASGIAWGYHMFFIFILVILYEQKKNKFFKDIYVILLILLMIFDIVGIPIFEVIVLKRRFFENFGLVLHLVSMFVVVPFIFVWRNDIENNVTQFISQKEMNVPNSFKSISIGIIVILIMLNAFGTFKVATMAQNYSDVIAYKVLPENGSDITAIPEKIVINFDSKIKRAKRTSHSINYNENTEIPEITDKWVDSKTLEITFNRKFKENETIALVYDITGELEDNIVYTRKLKLNYR